MARLLFLNHNWYGQGTFLRCYNLGRQLAARGHSVDLVTVSAESRYRTVRADEGRLRIIRTPCALGGYYQSGGWGVLDILARLSRCAAPRFDLVYAFDHRPNVSVPALVQRYLRGAPLFSDWADWWCGGGLLDDARNFPFQFAAERRLETGMKRISAGVTVISQALRDRAGSIGIPAERVLLLHSGADVERISPLPRDAARDSLGIPRGIRIAGYISANLLDAELLMRGMARVFRRMEDCRLLFIGPDEGWHRELARGLGVDDRILWTGFQPYARIAESLACADILLLPMSDTAVNRGRWPNRIGEHMAAGKATVSCAVGEMKKLFEAHPIGLLARPDEEDFAEKTLALLDAPEAAEEMGRRARTLAEGDYSWSVLADRFVSFWRRMI